MKNMMTSLHVVALILVVISPMVFGIFSTRAENTLSLPNGCVYSTSSTEVCDPVTKTKTMRLVDTSKGRVCAPTLRLPCTIYMTTPAPKSTEAPKPVVAPATVSADTDPDQSQQQTHDAEENQLDGDDIRVTDETDPTGESTTYANATPTTPRTSLALSDDNLSVANGITDEPKETKNASETEVSQPVSGNNNKPLNAIAMKLKAYIYHIPTTLRNSRRDSYLANLKFLAKQIEQHGKNNKGYSVQVKQFLAMIQDGIDKLEAGTKDASGVGVAKNTETVIADVDWFENVKNVDDEEADDSNTTDEDQDEATQIPTPSTGKKSEKEAGTHNAARMGAEENTETDLEDVDRLENEENIDIEETEDNAVNDTNTNDGDVDETLIFLTAMTETESTEDETNAVPQDTSVVANAEVEGTPSETNVPFMEILPEGCEYKQIKECNGSVIRLALVMSQSVECPDVIHVPCLMSARRFKSAESITEVIVDENEGSDTTPDVEQPEKLPDILSILLFKMTNKLPSVRRKRDTIDTAINDDAMANLTSNATEEQVNKTQEVPVIDDHLFTTASFLERWFGGTDGDAPVVSLPVIPTACLYQKDDDLIECDPQTLTIVLRLRRRRLPQSRCPPRISVPCSAFIRDPASGTANFSDRPPVSRDAPLLDTIPHGCHYAPDGGSTCDPETNTIVLRLHGARSSRYYCPSTLIRVRCSSRKTDDPDANITDDSSIPFYERPPPDCLYESRGTCDPETQTQTLRLRRTRSRYAICDPVIRVPCPTPRPRTKRQADESDVDLASLTNEPMGEVGSESTGEVGSEPTGEVGSTGTSVEVYQTAPPDCFYRPTGPCDRQRLTRPMVWMFGRRDCPRVIQLRCTVRGNFRRPPPVPRRVDFSDRPHIRRDPLLPDDMPHGPRRAGFSDRPPVWRDPPLPNEMQHGPASRRPDIFDRPPMRRDPPLPDDMPHAHAPRRPDFSDRLPMRHDPPLPNDMPHGTAPRRPDFSDRPPVWRYPPQPDDMQHAPRRPDFPERPPIMRDPPLSDDISHDCLYESGGMCDPETQTQTLRLRRTGSRNATCDPVIRVPCPTPRPRTKRQADVSDVDPASLTNEPMGEVGSESTGKVGSEPTGEVGSEPTGEVGSELGSEPTDEVGSEPTGEVGSTGTSVQVYETAPPDPASGIADFSDRPPVIRDPPLLDTIPLGCRYAPDGGSTCDLETNTIVLRLRGARSPRFFCSLNLIRVRCSSRGTAPPPLSIGRMPGPALTGSDIPTLDAIPTGCSYETENGAVCDTEPETVVVRRRSWFPSPSRCPLRIRVPCSAITPGLLLINPLVSGRIQSRNSIQSSIVGMNNTRRRLELKSTGNGP